MSRTITSEVVLTKPPDAPGYNGYYSMGENDCKFVAFDSFLIAGAVLWLYAKTRKCNSNSQVHNLQQRLYIPHRCLRRQYVWPVL